MELTENENSIFLSSEDYEKAIASSKTHIAIKALRNIFAFDNTLEGMNLKK